MSHFRGQYKRIVKGTARFFYHFIPREQSLSQLCAHKIAMIYCKRFVSDMKQYIHERVFRVNGYIKLLILSQCYHFDVIKYVYILATPKKTKLSRVDSLAFEVLYLSS